MGRIVLLAFLRFGPRLCAFSNIGEVLMRRVLVIPLYQSLKLSGPSRTTCLLDERSSSSSSVADIVAAVAMRWIADS